jgi:hypothetical protein
MTKKQKQAQPQPAAPVWTSHIVGYGEEAPDQLLAHTRNPRRHDRYQQAIMEASLREIGLVQDVIVNQRTGMVIDGHMRVQLALRVGMPTIPVKYVDLDEETELVAIASFDAIAGMAESDEAAFTDLLDSVAFTDDTLNAFLETLADHGGDVPADTASGDDMTPSTQLPSFAWGDYSTLMMQQEYDAFLFQHEAWVKEHGSPAGFITSLLTGWEIRLG